VRLSHLLQEFRSLSRQQQFALQPTNLSTVVQEVMTTESGYYTERGVSVDHHLPLELPLVMADGDKLKQVVLNLCKNAVEAMPDGGTLSVRLQQTGEQVTLAVADTGMGIPVGVDVFEPFVTTKSEGTGLGLAIVRQIIAAHSGTLNYTSVPGKGTTFVVTLPLLPANENGRPSSALGVTA
jgi:two-component system, LuxR family, sensor kinase FixL